MAEFVLFCVPTAVYLFLQTRGDRRDVASTMKRAGLSWGSPSAYLWAASLLIPLVLLGWLAITCVPQEVLRAPGVSIAQVTSVSAGIGVLLRAVGEEIFFRGLLGEALVRKVGFGWGNVFQALLFLIPHLALLLVDPRLWPLLPVQFAAGWLLGWLRHRAGSFLPGAAAHALANITAGVFA
ncbi:CPBP family intramembrane glutamic endopeptidase [Brevibacterium spongiae]|uniref:CPBP family intramembrane metalloprotease n=1 Tax=Brevibacterium spongiae TaxID=2909672 RepID=A0ABY5SNY5_9MICO|nr:CPBP family intramembrane glutamic endopeptidase [Brevibacterium spongiae]UVI36270.1 CPBP family intramembrane metalloprotease [Brevibacterium spongiae]